LEKYLEVGFMLDGAHASDARLRTVPLNQVIGCWKTESIKFSDGTNMSGTSQGTTD